MQVWKECKDNYLGNETKLVKNESDFIVSNYQEWIHKLVELGNFSTFHIPYVDTTWIIS